MERERAAALVLRRVLASGGYGAAAARARVAPGAPYLNASDLFEARFDERVTSELVGAGDAEGMLLALFGVVYRYAVRTDENPMLKQGVVGAFVITRSWALIDPPTTCDTLVRAAQGSRP